MRPPTSWQDAAATPLSRLTEPHRSKKVATVLALVRVRMDGQSEESVWANPNVCSRNAYHTKWKKDPTFAGVLREVTELAHNWEDGAAMRSLNKAAENLALAATSAVTTLMRLMTSSSDEAIQLRASLGILDRAGVETAVKNRTETNSTVKLDVTKLSDDELHAIANSSGQN